jgi:ABC-type transport system substrate-binding protein
MIFGTGKSSILGSPVVQDLWKQEGIEISIQLADIATSRDVYYNRAGQDLMNTFQNTGDYSLNWFAQNKFACENFQNTAWICDPEVQRVVKEVKVTTDSAKQRQLAKFLWDFDTLQVYNIWLPTTPSLSISGPRVRNYVIRQSFTNNLTYEWLSDGPRSSP